jgi:hypothetical protein
MREKLPLSSVESNPNQSVARPLETRIERSQPAPDSLSFRIPASGNWGGLLWIAIGWNLFTWFCAVLTIAELITGNQELERSEESNTPFKVIMSILLLLFIAVGWGMINMAVWHRFGTARLDLTPDSIRLYRTLFGRTKTYGASLAEVREVGLIEFYKRCGQPVEGIRIETDQASLCFGSPLSEDEKNWLCSEIRDFLRSHGCLLPIDDAATGSPDTTRR